MLNQDSGVNGWFGSEELLQEGHRGTKQVKGCKKLTLVPSFASRGIQFEKIWGIGHPAETRAVLWKQLQGHSNSFGESDLPGFREWKFTVIQTQLLLVFPFWSFTKFY